MTADRLRELIRATPMTNYDDRPARVARCPIATGFDRYRPRHYCPTKECYR